jgi:hypothetical protein
MAAGSELKSPFVPFLSKIDVKETPDLE